MDHAEQKRQTRGLPSAIEIDGNERVHDTACPRGADRESRIVGDSRPGEKIYECFARGDEAVPSAQSEEDLDEFVEALACLCAMIDFRRGRRKRSSAFSKAVEGSHLPGDFIDDVE